MEQPNAFVGRQATIEAVTRALAAGERILTVTGTGGIGKTRLVRHLLARGHGQLGFDAARFCDLTVARSDVDVSSAVARALGAPVAAPDAAEAAASVGAALARSGRALVVLDNFEQVVEHAAHTVGVWARLAPATTFLVTSRERLRIDGEVVIELPPLQVPPHGRDDPDAEAMRLFVDRVQRLRSGYEIAGEEVAVVADLVRRLEGIPLAIELCAARANVLAPAQLLERLSGRLDLLAAGARSAEGRHATLRGAIDWSWDLLDAEEQRALCRCSLFQGAFDVADAEALLGNAGRPPLDLVQALRDKSLLAAAPARDLPETRFSMFESVRQYASEKLRASGGESEAFERHADWVVASVQRWAGRVWSHGGMEAMRRLAHARDDAIAVLHRTLAAPERTATSAQRAAGIVAALEPLFTMGEPAGAVVSLCDAALAHVAEVERVAAGATDPALVATTLVARARAQRLLGRFDDAASDARRAADLAGARGDVRGEALALLALGELAYDRGLPGEAREPFERALAAVRGGGEDRLLGLLRTRLGGIAGVAGRIEEALEHVRAGAVLLRRAGDQRGEITAEHMLGWLSCEIGDTARARAHCTAALALAEQVGGRSTQTAIFRTLAHVAQDEQDARAAEELYARAIAVARDLGALSHVAILGGELAGLLREQGRMGEAVERARESVAILEELGQHPAQAVCRGELGALAATTGDVAEAERCFDAADALLGTADDLLRRSILAVQRGHLELALARAARDAADANARREDVRRRLDAPEIARFVEVRLAARRLREALRAEERPSDALLVAHDGAWFRPPRGEVVDVHRRAPLRRLLLALVQRRLRAPGQPMLLPELCSETWPTESLERTAAANRAYVAINTLRSLGLKAVLLSAEQGWLLDPAVAVHRVESSAVAGS